MAETPLQATNGAPTSGRKAGGMIPEGATAAPSGSPSDLFSPRSAAAVALSNFSQQQQQQQQEQQKQQQKQQHPRRSCSPPPAFLPPRASFRVPPGVAKQKQLSEPRLAPHPPQPAQPPHPHAPHYYAMPWQHTNTWQTPHSLRHDPRAAVAMHHPALSSNNGLEPQPLVPQPLHHSYYNNSNARQRPPPHSLVTPTPKKPRTSTPLASSLEKPQPHHHHLASHYHLYQHHPLQHHAVAPLPPPKATQSTSSSTSTTTTSTNNTSSMHNLKEASIYSRKNKSLGVLAETFCNRYAHCQPNTEIVLDAVAQDLGVERRRIYDVVNILESIKVVVKIRKNTYVWMGSKHLPNMFALLQKEALSIYPQEAVRNGLLPHHDGVCNSGGVSKEDCKSLSRLSQHFLQLYLVGNAEMSLPDASDKIHGETTVKQLAALGSRGREPVDVFDPKKFQQAAARGLKTKIRRLYDIANVFLAVGILTKLDNSGLRSSNDRPTFCWSFSVSPRELMHVYERMPAYMKEEQTPFSSNNNNLEEVGVGVRHDLKPLQKPRYVPPQPSPTTTAATSATTEDEDNDEEELAIPSPQDLDSTLVLSQSPSSSSLFYHPSAPLSASLINDAEPPLRRVSLQVDVSSKLL